MSDFGCVNHMPEPASNCAPCRDTYWRARCRELIVAAAEQLVEVQRRAGALSADWDPEQWRVEAEIIADRLLGESTR